MIFAWPGSEFWNTPNFRNNWCPDREAQFMTIGGYGRAMWDGIFSNIFLRGDFNRPADADLSIKTNWYRLTPPNNNTVSSFINMLILLTNNFNNNFNNRVRVVYTPTAIMGFNSNSFTSGLLYAVGVGSPSRYTAAAPGWGPLLAWYFLAYTGRSTADEYIEEDFKEENYNYMYYNDGYYFIYRHFVGSQPST